MHCPVRGIPCDGGRDSFSIKGADEHGLVRPLEEGSTMHSAWKRPHDLADDACPECQGSTYVPGPMYDERMVDECPKCGGTGKDATKKPA
jgi:hypothetical protein